MSALLVVLVGLAGLGALVDRALFGAPGRGAIEQGGRALMFGFGAAGAVSMGLDALGLGVRPATVGAALALLAALLWWRRTRLPTAAPAPREAEPPAPLAQRALVAGLLLFAALSLGQAVVSAAVRPAFQFDSLTRWMFKTKVLALDGTLVGPLSTDPHFGFTHQRYPPLVSHVSNLPLLVSGGFDDRLAQAPYAWYAVALAAIAFGALRRRAGALKAALGAAWIASLPLISYVPYPPPGAGAASAMADIPFALFLTGAALALLDALDGARDRAHLEVGLLLGFATLTKNEGLPLVVVAALALLLCARRARLRAALGPALVAGALFFALWGWLAAGFPALDENYPARLHLAAVREGLTRVPLVLGALADEVVTFRAWNLTWPAILALLVLGRLSRPVLAALIVVVGQLAVYVFAYVVTSWSSPAAEYHMPDTDPVVYLVTITLARLLLHVAPLAIIAALLAAPRLTAPPPAVGASRAAPAPGA